MKPYLGLLISLLVCMPLAAAEADPSSDLEAPAIIRDLLGALHTVYIENDGAIFKPNGDSDRHYTSGFRATATWQPAFAERWARDMTLFWDHPADRTRSAFGISFGQSIYTPEDIERRTVDPDDRPYAGWLYGGAYWQRSTDAPRHEFALADHFEFNVGVVGPSAQAEWAQNKLHVALDIETAKGWDHQLHDEPAFNFIYRRTARAPLPDFWGLEHELLPSAGFTLGTVFRHVEGNLTYRLGFELPADFGPGRLSEPAIATGSSDFQASGPISFYAFARAGGRIVEHNLLLEGNTWKDSHGVEPEPFVGEVQLGLNVRLWRANITYSQTYCTEEFEGQNGGDSYGALVVTGRIIF